MALENMLKGIGVGFAIAAPVGPIGMLCIRRSLLDGWRHGLATGLGAASADALYGCVAAFGLTAISSFLTHYAEWFRLLGGAFLCYLGIKIFVSRQPKLEGTANHGCIFPAYVITLMLTLTNPATILSFIAVFAGLGLAASPTAGSVGGMVVGVFVGSALWWLLLSSFVSLFRSAISAGLIKCINYVSGILLFGFGVYSFTQYFQK